MLARRPRTRPANRANRLPVLGSVFRAAALSRFARALGTLVKSGVSLLPSLKIVENTIGNRVLAKQVACVGPGLACEPESKC